MSVNFLVYLTEAEKCRRSRRASASTSDWLQWSAARGLHSSAKFVSLQKRWDSMEEIEDMARKGTWRKQRPAGPVTSRQTYSARQQQQPPSQSQQSRSRRRSRARSRSTSQEISPSFQLPVVDDWLQRPTDSYQDDLDLPDVSAML
ncbi:hypothetical protein GGI03_004599 [Coemansia sp. RSA 2337]|nr:hypothetical protein GGI03_004599 [Coemansia sp. RSA 2337]